MSGKLDRGFHGVGDALRWALQTVSRDAHRCLLLQGAGHDYGELTMLEVRGQAAIIVRDMLQLPRDQSMALLLAHAPWPRADLALVAEDMAEVIRHELGHGYGGRAAELACMRAQKLPATGYRTIAREDCGDANTRRGRDIVREVMGVLDVIRQRGEERLYDVLLRKGLLAASAREDTVRVIRGGKVRMVRI